MGFICKQTSVGVYAGTFDPVHAGHLSFALDAQRQLDLDTVYFLPERLPRNKPWVEHYGHRVAMLRRAIKPHSTLALLELVDKQFTLNRTLPQLKRQFHNVNIVLLMGSDAFVNVPLWQDEHEYLKDC